MKTIVTLLLLSCSTFTFLFAQLPHLHVEGHAKIRGNIDINHMDDTTTVLIGRMAGINSTFGTRRFNTFVGSYAGYMNTTADDNSFFGFYAGFENNGNDNSFFGNEAGLKNTSGYENSFFGEDAGRENTSGRRNSFFGEDAGHLNTTGNFNSFFGSSAGFYVRTGTRNTFIGHGADKLSGDSLDRAIAIGYNARVGCSHCAVIGGTGTDTVNVGIGTHTPLYRLHVVGGDRGVYSEGNSVGGEFHSTKGIDVNNPGIGVKGVAMQIGNPFINCTGGKGVVGVGGTFGADFSAEGNGVDYASCSSIRWKTDVRNIPNPLEMLNKLRGVYFTWDQEHGGQSDVGFIAEEVGKVLPQIVMYESNGADASSLDYSKITPLLVEASNAMRKEYQNEIHILQQENKELKSRLDKLEAILRKLDIAQNLGE